MEVEGIQGAGPQILILGGWLPPNQLILVIIPPLPSPPFRFVPPIPIYKCKEGKLMKLLCITLVLIFVFYLKQWLTIPNGELGHHHACPENITVLHYAMLVDLGEDPPIF
jgi:hypothetical protein